MPQYFSLVTLNGQAKVADAIANVSAVNITHLAVGDGNGAPVTPLETQAALVPDACDRRSANPNRGRSICHSRNGFDCERWQRVRSSEYCGT